ncbi:MAG: metal ABC transporter permease, partial [Gammaproteobacteria bacterium]|nr:metal ABC transporter permease [Gammaproteobacteria bacterium]
MLDLWEHYHWLTPPFVAGLLVVVTHVVFGQEVLRRGIIFIDLTIAQMAALGVIVAVLLGLDGGWLTQAFAVGAAFIASLGLSWSEKRYPQKQ